METFAGFLLFEAGEGPGTRKPGKQAVVGKRCEPLDKNTFHFKKRSMHPAIYFTRFPVVRESSDDQILDACLFLMNHPRISLS